MDDVITAAGPALEAKIGAYRRERRLPGIAAGIATAEGLRWCHGAGFADVDAGRRPDERTLYRIASITKTITATAVMQLRDEGRLGLDDPVVGYIPELGQVTSPFAPVSAITIRRLLQHTSGIQSEVPWLDLDDWWMHTPDELVRLLDRVRVRTPPEVDHKYSNLAFELLGIVVARIAGQPFPGYAKANVLDPLGMADTVWHPVGEQVARKAVGYDARAYSDTLAPARDIDSDKATADGGLWSTLEDLGRWIAQQLRTDDGLERGPGQVLRGKTLREMHRPTFVSKPDLTEGQGLGWYATRKAETILVGHSGGLYGFITNISFSAERKVGAIVLLNGIGDASPLARDLLEALLPALKEAEDRAPADPPVPCPAAYEELLGVYRDPSGMDDATIEWRDGKLVAISGPEGPAAELSPTDDPLQFTMHDGRAGGEPLVFIRGEDGRIDRANAAGYPGIRVDLMRQPAQGTG